MANTVVGLYKTFPAGQKVVGKLINAGFDRNQINIMTHEASKNERAALDDIGVEHTTYVDEGAVAGAGTGALVGGVGGILAGLGALFIPGIGPIVAAGPLIGALMGAGIGVASGGVLGGLVGLGVSKDDAEYYAEAIRRGGTLVTVQAEDSRVPLATEIMNRYDPAEVDQLAAEWRASGWERFDENAPAYSATDVERERNLSRTQQTAAVVDGEQPASTSLQEVERDGGQIVVPIVEETMKVSKHAVRKGGVRVHKVVQTVPVEESIDLREETLTVERRSVDRVAGQHAFDEIETGTVNITAMTEKAVVSKEARVVEEVVIQKDVLEHTEQIKDTVRRTEVQLDERQPLG